MNEDNYKEAEDRELQQLLRTVGSRSTPPRHVMEEVRQAVHGEWTDIVAARSRARRARYLAWAASIAAIALLATSLIVVRFAPAQDMAVVARIEGTVHRDAGLLHAAAPLMGNDRLRVGDEVFTDSAGRGAFVTEQGLSFRIDTQTRVHLVALDRVELIEGALYVDADPTEGVASSFAVDTRSGTVRHIGTQYEVRTTPQAVQISVREGRVAIDTNGVLHAGNAGERIAIGHDGSVRRSELREEELIWHWTSQIAPGFDIDNQPLLAFLSWFERETGHKVQFADSNIQSSAAQTTLRGSIEGLDPKAALGAVLATTNMSFSEMDNGTIVISANEQR